MTGAEPARVRCLIVGTPRSGTTLVQRLAAELPGVAVPFETHFFTKGIEHLRDERGGLVARDRLAPALAAYAASDALEGAGLDIDSVLARLDPETAPSLLTVFDAVVADLAGAAEVLGEKTPGHVHWAGAIARARPDVAVIAVVRDPRAAIASQHRTPWGGIHVDMAARRWLDDQRAVAELAATRPDRTLVVRYEDLVGDPAGVQTAIARLLDRSPVLSGAPGAPGSLALPWETWKDGVGEPITADRVRNWTVALRPVDVDRIGVICAPMLDEFGYGDARPSAGRALRVRVFMPRKARIRARRYARRSAAKRAAIAATEL